MRMIHKHANSFTTFYSNNSFCSLLTKSIHLHTELKHLTHCQSKWPAIVLKSHPKITHLCLPPQITLIHVPSPHLALQISGDKSHDPNTPTYVATVCAAAVNIHTSAGRDLSIADKKLIENRQTDSALTSAPHPLSTCT